ncbi:MAG: tRNA dihydrouridine(20/20a) synthase DusA [Granulosicoccaceae bacterium]
MSPVISVAPMLDWTDKHYRFLARLISKRAQLWSEMVTTGALLHGDPARHLDFNAEEHPLVLQLGGSDPVDMAACARMAEQWGYDEVNINVGCPSDRVQKGRFGACLMAEPQTVADCVKAMQKAVSIPVTVKCRIGIDRDDAYEPLQSFVEVVSDAGCQSFVVHARKAWLDGLSPAQNRNIPPLRYEYVHRLKSEMPELHVAINGGISTWEQASEHLPDLDGVMIGRAAYQGPWLLSSVDRLFFGAESDPDRWQVVEQWRDYVGRQLALGVPLMFMTRHMLGLFNSMPGARGFRRHLSENAYKKGADLSVLDEALAKIRRE